MIYHVIEHNLGCLFQLELVIAISLSSYFYQSKVWIRLVYLEEM